MYNFKTNVCIWPLVQFQGLYNFETWLGVVDYPLISCDYPVIKVVLETLSKCKQNGSLHVAKSVFCHMANLVNIAHLDDDSMYRRRFCVSIHLFYVLSCNRKRLMEAK